MQKKGQATPAGAVILTAETYQALVEDRLLQRMRGDNLQRKNEEFRKEVGGLLAELDTVKDERDRMIECAKAHEDSAAWWTSKCMEVERERDALLKALNLGEDAGRKSES